MKLSRALIRACFALLLLQTMLTAGLSGLRAQAPATKRVLVLYWYGRDFRGNVRFDQAFRAALQARAAGTVEYYPEYLETDRFPGENQAQLLQDYLRRKYAERPIDVLVTSADPSLEFMLKNREQLFPYAPIVFTTVKPPPAEQLTIGPGMTGIRSSNTHRTTIQLALRLQPDTEQVFVISGSLEGQNIFESQAREELRSFEGRVQINYLSDLPKDELLSKVANLPDHSIILFIWQQPRDEKGQLILSADTLTLVASHARVPVYGMSSSYLGRGIVGGDLYTTEDVAARVADMALRILNGERAQDIQIETAPTVPTFDWRELKRRGISEAALPPGSVVQFKEPTLWEQHKHVVLIALALFIFQTGLIVWLLAERRRRRQAEEVRRHMAAIVESSDDAIIGVTSEGQILSWNPGAELLYGFTAAEVLGRNITIVVPPDRLDELGESIRQCTQGMSKKDFETIRVRKDGRRIDVSITTSPIRNDKGRIIAHSTITRDITARKQAEEELQRLTGKLLNLQDDERRRLALELHDVTAQNLFAINMNLSRLQRGRVAPWEIQEILNESRMLGNQSLQEIRTLSYLLHPPMLDQTGLVNALSWYVDGFVKRSGIDVEVGPVSELGRLPSEVETALFRIVQEGLTNIKRHSGSSSANITLEKHSDRVVLQIRDHGQGIKSELELSQTDTLEKLGVGIPGMRQRLRRLGGDLQIESGDHGTVVIATVPIQNGDNHDPDPGS